jgi:cell division protein FtsB
MINHLKKYYEIISPYIRNKYLVSTAFVFLWVLFFDQNNLLDRYKLIREVNQLEKEHEYYKERIHLDSTRLIELKTSPENLEKFAREQFLMKKDNEDIFVIVEEGD